MKIPSYLCLVALILFVLKVLKIWNKKSNPPPGPRRLPLIGNIHQLVGCQTHQRLAELAKTYGPIMHIQLGQLPLAVISSAEIAKEVMKTQESKFLGRPSLVVADIMVYNRRDLSFAPYGDYYRQMKKIAMVDLFGAKRVQSFKPVFEEQISKFIEFINSNAGTPINLSRKLNSLGDSIVVATTIGKNFRQQNEFLRIIDSAMKEAGGFSVADAFPSSRLLHMITGTTSALHKAHRRVDEILDQAISERKANRASSAEADTLLDVLLDIQEHQNLEIPLTTINVKAIILDVFAGAGDTSLVTAEWAVAEMVKNPLVMQKAQEEIRRVFDGKDNDNDRELKYLKLVIKETLRLHPPTPLIPRECGEKYEVNGFDIDSKTKVLVNVWAIGRDPNSWIHPDRFYPERFMDNSIGFRGGNFELLPFGAGKRICPGIAMSMAIIERLLARMLYHFDWKLTDDSKPESFNMDEAFGFIIKRKQDLVLIPTPFHPN